MLPLFASKIKEGAASGNRLRGCFPMVALAEGVFLIVVGSRTA